MSMAANDGERKAGRFGDRLTALRAPGESYSDVILRLARADGER
jgi:hypothetical protein